MKFKNVIIFGLGLGLSQMPQAATIDSTDQLPQAIQGCLTTADCLVNPISEFESEYIAAFRYTAADFNGYLFRYSVMPPSVATDVDDFLDFSEDPPIVRHYESNIPLGGTIWLQVAESYAVSAASRAVVLYMDKTLPSPPALLPHWGSEYGESLNSLQFELSPSALLGASAFRIFIDSSPRVSGGDLEGDILWPCLAEDCGVNQELNLIGMSFMLDGDQLRLQFAGSDKRRLLYTEALFYNSPEDSFHNQRDWYVQPVPLPAAWLMWLLGFAAWAGFSNRKASKTC